MKKTETGNDLRARERLVSDAFEQTIRSVRKTTHRSNAAKIYDLYGTILKRRKAATLNYMDTVCNRYSETYPEMDIAEEWVRHCCAPGHSIDGIDMLYHISLASAIWMLDELKRTRKLGEAFPYFHCDEDALDEVELPEMLFDPCHEDEVLRGMLQLIQERDERDNPFQWYINEITAARTTPVKHDIVDAEGNPSDRQRFNAVMSMVRPALKERAVKRFEAKMWEFLDLYFQCLNPLLKREKELERECDRLYERLQRLDAQIQSMKSPLAPLAMFPKAAMNKSSLSQPFQGMSTMAVPEKGLLDEIEPLAVRGVALQDQLDEANRQSSAFVLCAHMLSMMIGEDISENLDAKTIERMESFTVDDPYEICFGYLCLIESGSDLPWVYTAASAVLQAAAAKLPWTVKPLENLLDEFDDEDDDSPDDCAAADQPIDTGLDIEPMDWNHKKALLYERKYTQDVFALDDEPVPTRKINLPQLVYNLNGLVMPRTVSDYADMAELLEKSGLPADSANTMEYYLQLASDVQMTTKNWRYFLHSPGFQELSDLIQGEPEDEQEDRNIEDLEKTVHELKSQLNELKQSLYGVSKELASARAESEQIRSESASEHRELQDLREIVFNRKTGAEAEQPRLDTPIAFPARTKHRMVVFGGHDTWLKAIRPMLPDVEFVPRNQRPNANQIRYADVVWIQPNAIGHKDYYKIIDVVRTNHIPVRYFLYASAEKCAAQIVSEDGDAEWGKRK